MNQTTTLQLADAAEASRFEPRALLRLARAARQATPRRDANGALSWSEPRQLEELTAADFAAQLTYVDRDSYLAWVAAWKATYAELGVQIRADKRRCRELQRAGELAAGSLQVGLLEAGLVARTLLALRRVAKADSWARRNAAQES